MCSPLKLTTNLLIMVNLCIGRALRQQCAYVVGGCVDGCDAAAVGRVLTLQQRFEVLEGECVDVPLLFLVLWHILYIGEPFSDAAARNVEADRGFVVESLLGPGLQ